MPTTPTNAEIIDAAPNYAAIAAKACARAELSLEALEQGVVAELLTACKEARSWIGPGSDPPQRAMWGLLEAVIVKARGLSCRASQGRLTTVTQKRN